MLHKAVFSNIPNFHIETLCTKLAHHQLLEAQRLFLVSFQVLAGFFLQQESQRHFLEALTAPLCLIRDQELVDGVARSHALLARFGNQLSEGRNVAHAPQQPLE